jgi:ketosteroid isomerase-like protein
MKNLTITIIMLAAMAISAAAQCSEADKQALEALDRAWTRANETGDRAALMNLYADEYVSFPAMTNKTTAIDNAMAAFERNKANPSTATFTSDHYMISCTPVSATMTHRNSTTTKGADGKERTTYSRSVHVFEKRGGKWVAVSNAAHAMDDGATLWYLEQDWNNALMKRDKVWFEKHYASDFTGVSSLTGSVSNKSAEITDIVNDRGLEMAETSDMNVQVNGDMAVVTGIFRTKGKYDKGVAYDRRVRYIDTWVKRDGVWQAWTSQGTPIK